MTSSSLTIHPFDKVFGRGRVSHPTGLASLVSFKFSSYINAEMLKFMNSHHSRDVDVLSAVPFRRPAAYCLDRSLSLFTHSTCVFQNSSLAFIPPSACPQNATLSLCTIFCVVYKMELRLGLSVPCWTAPPSKHKPH